MLRRIRPVLTVLVGMLLLQCANRKWENIFDPASPTYPQIEYFEFEGYESYEGWYFLVWRLKFVEVLQRSYPFVLDLEYNGRVIDTYSFDAGSGYIGYYVGWDSWGPFLPGSYKAILKYGGEAIYDNAYQVSGLVHERKSAPAQEYLFEIHRLHLSP